MNERTKADQPQADGGGARRLRDRIHELAGGPWARMAPVVAAAVAASIIGLGWLAWVSQQHAQARADRQVVADQTAMRLKDWFVSRILVLNTYSAMRSEGLLADPADWRLRVQLDIAMMAGFQAINWVDDEGIIRVTAPVLGNEPALGRRVLDNPLAGSAFEGARTTRRPHVSRPLDLFQGGRGFATYLPIGDQTGAGLGYTNGVFRVDGMVSEALSHLDLTENQVLIRDGEDLVWASREPVDPAPPSASLASFGVAQRDWTVSVAPASPDVPRSWHVTAGLAMLAGAAAAASAGEWARRQAAETLRARAAATKATARLIEMERMEAVGRVAGGIAHDFNNLLTIVLGNAELLELDLSPQDRRSAESIASIRDAARQGSELTEALMTFASRGARMQGQVYAAAHLQTMGPMLRHVAGRATELRIAVSLDAVPLAIDPTAFDRILVNLITNASQALASTTGGLVEVGLTDHPAGAALTVRDNGPGMSADVRARVFEPFFTTRAQGNGQGLATVFGLVTQAQGSIDVETSPGRGCLFTIVLPLAGRPPAAAA